MTPLEQAYEQKCAECDALHQRVKELEKYNAGRTDEMIAMTRQLAACEKERDNIDRIASELQDTCHRQAQQLAVCEKERDEQCIQCINLSTAHYEVMALKKERDHWKANHDNRVAAARLLHYRLDLPLERVKAYEKYVEMQDRLVEVEKERDEYRRISHKQFTEWMNDIERLADCEKERDELRQLFAECQQYLKDGETPAERMARYHRDIQGLLGQLGAAKEQRDELRDAFQTFIDEHEECSDADDWMASMCSLEAVHEADSALNQDLNACHQSTTEDYSAVQAKD